MPIYAHFEHVIDELGTSCNIMQQNVALLIWKIGGTSENVQRIKGNIDSRNVTPLHSLPNDLCCKMCLMLDITRYESL